MKLISKYKKVIFLFIVLGIFAFTSGVLALELTWPAPPGGTALSDTTNIAQLVEYFYRWGIAIGGLAAFIALIIAGFQYLTSAGDPAKIKDAKDRIAAAFSGLVLLLASFLILDTINPELTKLRMPETNPPSATLPAIPPETPTLDQPCQKAIVYSQPNYTPGTELATINKNGTQNVTVSKESGSIKMEGNCRAELYKNVGCSGEPMASLFSSSPDISALYLKNDIQCIKVKE